MEVIIDGLAILALIFGVFFSIVGTVGIIRLPDAYNRLHASGKVGTLGLFGLITGAGLLMPSSALKLILLSLFVIMTAPVASHAIGVAVHRFTRPDISHRIS